MIVDEMKRNIKAYNRYMTDSALDKMDIDALLANCHPIDRRSFASRLFQLDLITEETYKKCKANTQIIELIRHENK